MVAALLATAIDYLAKEVTPMKWYFVPLSVLGITFLGGLGWYIGGLEKPYLACAAVLIVVVAYWVWLMKWYALNPLSHLVRAIGGAFGGVLGWYIWGGTDNLSRACFAVMIASVAYWITSISMDFRYVKRICLPVISNVLNAVVIIACGLIFVSSLLVSHHYHLH